MQQSLVTIVQIVEIEVKDTVCAAVTSALLRVSVLVLRGNGVSTLAPLNML